jgi:1-phosphofructokinase
MESGGTRVMLAICGSLPPGTPADFHLGLIRLGKKLGVPTIVDASGDVLTRAIPEGPDLIKPNVHELADETGRSINTLQDVVMAAQVLRARGAVAVLASLGADGMMLIDHLGALHGLASKHHGGQHGRRRGMPHWPATWPDSPQERTGPPASRAR